LLASFIPLAAPVETVKEGLLDVGVLPWYSVTISLSTTVVLLVTGLMFLNRHGMRLLGIDAFDEEDDDLL